MSMQKQNTSTVQGNRVHVPPKSELLRLNAAIAVQNIKDHFLRNKAGYAGLGALAVVSPFFGCTESVLTTTDYVKVRDTLAVHDTIPINAGASIYETLFVVNDTAYRFAAKGDRITLPSGDTLKLVNAGTSLRADDGVVDVSTSAGRNRLHINDTLRVGADNVRLYSMEQHKPGDVRMAVIMVFDRISGDTVATHAQPIGKGTLFIDYFKSGTTVHKPIPLDISMLFDGMNGKDAATVNGVLTLDSTVRLDSRYIARVVVMPVDTMGINNATFDIGIKPMDTTIAPFTSSIMVKNGKAVQKVAIGADTVNIEIKTAGRSSDGNVLLWVNISSENTSYQGLLRIVNGVPGGIFTEWGLFMLNDGLFGRAGKKNGQSGQ